MSIFAGNFLCRTGIQFQSRLLLISGTTKKKNSSSIIRCSKGRDYSSSFPVRYSPKKSSKPHELQTSLHVEVPEEVKEKRCSSGQNASNSSCEKLFRRSFAVDAEFHNRNQRPFDNLSFDVKSEAEEERDHHHDLRFEDYEFMEEPEEVVEELGIHIPKGANNHIEIPDAKTKEDAEKMAIELLAVRGFTAVELRKKLQGKRFPLDMVNAVIMDFQKRGLINDSLYAETFSQSRWSSSSWGPRRIKQALSKKGVSEKDTDKAIKLVFRDNESGGSGDQDSRLELSKASLDQLFIHASKQWLRGGQDVPRDKRKSRTIRWLQYRGFNWAVISFLLNKLESKHPS